MKLTTRLCKRLCRSIVYEIMENESQGMDMKCHVHRIQIDFKQETYTIVKYVSH